MIQNRNHGKIYVTIEAFAANFTLDLIRVCRVAKEKLGPVLFTLVNPNTLSTNPKKKKSKKISKSTCYGLNFDHISLS